MTNALIIHGGYGPGHYRSPKTLSPSNDHWLPWLQKHLLIRDILAQTPELPRPFDPIYADWRREVARYDLDDQSLVVAHSMGGGFTLRWLTEEPKYIKHLVLVAPWLNPDRKYLVDFLDFTLDPSLMERCGRIDIFVSNDHPSILQSVDMAAEALPTATIHRLEQMGHFTLQQMGTQAFHELLAVIDLHHS